MLINYSAIHATTLIVMLFACSAMSIIATGSLLKGSIRNSLALDTPNVAQLPVFVKRVLRSTTTSDNVTNLEERVPMGLEHTLQESFWLENDSITSLVNELKLAKTTDKLLGNPTFVDLAIFAEKRESLDDLYTALSSRFDDADLVEILAGLREIPQTKSIAEKLQIAQVNDWTKDKTNTVSRVFMSLKLNAKGGKLFKSFAFSQWLAYARKTDNPKPLVQIYQTLSNAYKENLVGMLVAGAKEEEGIVATLLEYQLLQWRKINMPSEYVSDILELDTVASEHYRSSFSKALLVYKGERSITEASVFKNLKEAFYKDQIFKVFKEKSNRMKEKLTRLYMHTSMDGITLPVLTQVLKNNGGTKADINKGLAKYQNFQESRIPPSPLKSN